jgi:hypothetical protein
VEYKGVEFTLTESDAGFWKYQMLIEGRTKAGIVRANLKLLAERRVRIKIDAELRKSRSKADMPPR